MKTQGMRELLWTLVEIMAQQIRLPNFSSVVVASKVAAVFSAVAAARVVAEDCLGFAQVLEAIGYSQNPVEQSRNVTGIQ